MVQDWEINDRDLKNGHEWQIAENLDDRVVSPFAAQGVGVRDQVLRHEEANGKNAGE